MLLMGHQPKSLRAGDVKRLNHRQLLRYHLCMSLLKPRAQTGRTS
jgi:hypothetical protein